MNEPIQTPSSTNSKKGFFQYRLSTLMVVCMAVAIFVSYGVRRYQANHLVRQIWQACENLLEDELFEIVAQSDELDGQVASTEMEFSRKESHYFSNGFPLFASDSFDLNCEAIFRWNGHRDEYALVGVSARLPRIDRKLRSRSTDIVGSSTRLLSTS